MALTRGQRRQIAERDALLVKGLKRCGHCQEIKPLSAFSKSRCSPTGRRSWCKLCIKAGRVTHQRRRAEYDHRYYREHRKESAERVREYRKTHPKAVRQCQEQYRQSHRQQIAAYQFKYSQTEGGRAKRREVRNRRRARIVGLASTLTEAEWQKALAWFDNRCAYCGISDVSLQQDHLAPLSAGGAYIARNIIPACKLCNRSKSNTPLDEWVDGCGRAFVRAGALEKIKAYVT